MADPLFGITLSIVAFGIGIRIQKKTGSALANPLIIAMVLVMLVLVVFDIPLEAYEAGGSFITFFLPPVTTVLALSIYRQRKVLQAYLIPIGAGTLTGSIVAVASTIFLSRAFGLEEIVVRSLASKSVTAAVAVALTDRLGGIPALTIASTVITGMTGNILAPYLGKIFGVTDKVAHGVGIGTSSHALGTSRALELGEIEGSMSSISISFSALWTTLILAFVFRLAL
ncbi:MAG TPA: LrgB family protein [Sphaerochaeta sp.]|nr:LrgB family protein [Sphaerochaeta sp.]